MQLPDPLLEPAVLLALLGLLHRPVDLGVLPPEVADLLEQRARLLPPGEAIAQRTDVANPLDQLGSQHFQQFFCLVCHHATSLA